MDGYLIRFAEFGREMQPSRQALRHDIVRSIRSVIPGAPLRADTGRIWLEIDTDVAAQLATIDGIESFSRFQRCRIDRLEASAIEFARARLDPDRSFRVVVTQVGPHHEPSPELAARLGAAIVDAVPGLRVELSQPEQLIGVEIRDGDCYLFAEVTAGLGRSHTIIAPARADCFVVDQMLGPLARWLRLFGFDTRYLRDVADSTLLRLARDEARILITRDRALAERGGAAIVYLHSTNTDDQLRELVDRCALNIDAERLFSRCTLCNRLVETVSKESVAGLVPAGAYREHEQFTRCPSCRRVYWAGSHYQRILERVQAIAPGAALDPDLSGPDTA